MDDQEFHWVNTRDDKNILSFIRGDLLFVYNFSPTESYADFEVPARPGIYRLILSSDDPMYGGFGRVDDGIDYATTKSGQEDILKIYIPARVALVFNLSQAHR